jgi:hypothetical protein
VKINGDLASKFGKIKEEKEFFVNVAEKFLNFGTPDGCTFAL